MVVSQNNFQTNAEAKVEKPPPERDAILNVCVNVICHWCNLKIVLLC